MMKMKTMMVDISVYGSCLYVSYGMFYFVALIP